MPRSVSWADSGARGGVGQDDRVRHTEFWERLDLAMGVPALARQWARSTVLSPLGERTVEEALAAGVDPKEVWAVVWAELRLPERER